MKDDITKLTESKPDPSGASVQPGPEHEQPLSEEEMEGVTGGLGLGDFKNATDATHVLEHLTAIPDIKKLNKGVMGN